MEGYYNKGEWFYYNFPIELLKEYWYDKPLFITNVINYGLYEYCTRRRAEKNPNNKGRRPTLEEVYESMNASIGINNPNSKNIIDTYEITDSEFNEALYNCIEHENFEGEMIEETNISKDYAEAVYNSATRKALTGIRIDTLEQLYSNELTEKEELVILMQLALKSIIGKKKSIKTNYDLIFSRISGSTTTLLKNNLPIELQKWTTFRKRKNLRDKLELDYNWTFEGYRIKGFYASNKLNHRELIYSIHSKKQSNRIKELEAKKKINRKNLKL